jgi:glycosyltransferase involved in cell wall biosynthesis
MKVVMINDCAYVGETLLKYMPPNVEKQHIKRTKGLWSKTFGLAYKILRANGDVYHAHYLLQDCYIAARLGKRPLVGHAHGSDLRVSLKHWLWRRVVRHNLKQCNKVLVSTPDVLSIAKQHREDAEYLPNSVDSNLFYPKPVIAHNGKKKVLIASGADWSVKGTDITIKALSKIKSEVQVSIIEYGVDFDRTVTLASSLGLRLNILPKASHERLSEHYWAADIVIDQFKLGALGMISLETIACGRPVITYVSSEYDAYKDFPMRDVNSVDKIIDVMSTAPQELWKKEYTYLLKYHKPEEVVRRILAIYRSLE